MENHEGSAQACATAFIRMDVDKLTKANLQVRREKKHAMLSPPDNFETICDHPQLRKQRHGHGKALIFCDPSVFQISATKVMLSV